MNIRKLFFALATMAVMVATFAQAQAADLTWDHDADADAKGEHVLFIGNSCTEAHNLPEIVRLIADANGAAINTDVALMNGATLDAIRKKPEHQEKIKSRRWDAIILEPHSTGPIFDVHKTIKGAAHVAEMCYRARVYVFATWAYASEAQFLEETDALKKAEAGAIILDEYKDMYKNMQMLLDVGAAQVAKGAKTVKINKRNKQVKTAVVPVGSVWQAALKKHPDWQLHDRDGYHPSKAGSYLSALVFYRVLLGHVPEKAATEWVDQGWIDQATHDKMIAVIQSMPSGKFAADGKLDAERKAAAQPQKKEKWVSLTKQKGGEWQMKVVEHIDQAPEGWTDPKFDDSSWNTAKLPISWTMYHTALFRGTFNIKDKSAVDGVRVMGKFFQQANVMVYLNGKLVAKTVQLDRGEETTEARLTDYATKLLKKGENTIAISSRHKRRWGGYRGTYTTAKTVGFWVEAKKAE